MDCNEGRIAVCVCCTFILLSHRQNTHLTLIIFSHEYLKHKKKQEKKNKLKFFFMHWRGPTPQSTVHEVMRECSFNCEKKKTV